jgi:tripartite-type tricarboxylate transporter receptor subunit TctC
MKVSLCVGGAAALAAVVRAPLAAAAEKIAAFPERPIRLVVPFPPGGGTDLVSRIMQPALQQRLGQQIVIDNRGGAQGILGTQIAATAAPDGYTVVIAEIGATAVAPALMPNIKLDVVRDFAPISQLTTSPVSRASRSAAGTASWRRPGRHGRSSSA